VTSAPLFVADQLGFFQKRGITLAKTPTNDIYGMLAPLSQGQLDVLQSASSPALFNALNQGLRFKVVADRLTSLCSSENMLVVRRELWDQGVRRAADLKGKKVGSFAPGSATSFWLDRWLADNGMSAADMGQIIYLGPVDTSNALQNAAIDAGFVGQPAALPLLTQRKVVRLATPHEMVPGQQLGVWVMSDQFLANSGDVAARWLAAWIEGVRFVNDPKNKDQVIDVVSKATEVERDRIATLYGTDQFPYANPNGTANAERMEREDATWMLQKNLIQKLPERSAWYSDAPIRAALQLVSGEVDAKRSCDNIPRLSVDGT
jgi:ABC-type nitrate/sulfonate/bicarbonate transport system substrate-binding protein